MWLVLQCQNDGDPLLGRGKPQDCIVQDAEKAMARPLWEFERLQFKIDPLDKGLYYVTYHGELIDEVTKEKAEEAQKARIQVQKEAEGCLKQMLAVTGSTGSIERSFTAVAAAHYRQIDLMVSHNANTY